jgi:hypothetical protein
MSEGVSGEDWHRDQQLNREELLLVWVGSTIQLVQGLVATNGRKERGNLLFDSSFWSRHVSLAAALDIRQVLQTWTGGWLQHWPPWF